MRDFLSLYVKFWRTCWRNPWWYIAVFMFALAPPLSSAGKESSTFPPWWPLIFIPAMILFISVIVVLLSLEKVNNARAAQDATPTAPPAEATPPV